MLDDDRSFADNLDATLAGQASPRAWGRRIGLLLATCVCAALVMGLMARGARIASTIEPGIRYTVELSSDLSWGAFTITTGKARATLPVTGVPLFSARYAAPAVLAITYVAPPFVPVTCRVSLPRASDDTCRNLSSGDVGAPDSHGIVVLSVHFRMTSSDLPPTTEQALLADLNQKVLADASRVAIPAGGHYAVGTVLRTYPLATRPLTASLLSTRATQQRLPDRTCPALCGADIPYPLVQTSGQQIWHALIYIDQRWRVSDPAGTVLGTVNESAVSRALGVDLGYDAATQTWSIVGANALGDDLCWDGEVNLQSFVFVPDSGLAAFVAKAVFDDHLLAGCVLHLNATDGTATADFLWRLGGLYAVNATAHAALPSLPVATPADVAALG